MPRVGHLLAAAAVAVPIGALATVGPATPAAAAAPGGTLVIIQDDTVYAVAGDGSVGHAVVTADPANSVSMDDDGVIYLASDRPHFDDEATMWAFTQDGTVVDSWNAFNPAVNEAAGSIIDTEMRRDGQLLMSEARWVCSASSTCNIRSISERGSSSALGSLYEPEGAGWLGNSDYLVVDGGRRYYRVGDPGPVAWFDDERNSAQPYADSATTADGSVLVTTGDYEVAPESWDFNNALHFYSVNGLPPTAPTPNCFLPVSDLIDWPAAGAHYGHYVQHVSFSPNGDALAFAAGELGEMTAYVVTGLDTATCEFDEVTTIMSPVKDIYWGHADYEPAPDADLPAPDPAGAAIVPVRPARYWDTRPEITFDESAANTGRLAGGASYAVQIGGRGQVPSGARGVVANLTVIAPDGPGFATLYPCDSAPPVASHLNYVPGTVAANNAVVPLDGDGRVCIFTKAAADFVLDVNGYVPAGSDLAGITPARYLDTRAGATTFDGAAMGAGAVPAGTHTEVQIAGRGKVPVGSAAALVTVTAVGPDAAGFVTLYPCGERPGTSTLNYGPGGVVPNGALVALSPAGTVCVFTKATSHLLIDVAGYLPAGTATLASLTPARLADTRPGHHTVDGQHAGTGRLDAGAVIEVQVAGRGNVPAAARAGFFNVTVVGPDGPGYVTLYPCGSRPHTSNLNHSTAGMVRANNAMTQLSAEGTVCAYTKAGADLVLDVTGWAG